jgi:glycyl-tRNA synthetase beta chain
MMSKTLLVELRTEEIPPRALLPMSEAFAKGLARVLGEAQFLTPASVVSHFATPRRLAVAITDVVGRSPDRTVREKIMPISVALDASGAPSVALRKKLAALKLEQVSISDFERAVDGKTEVFFYSYSAPGERLQDCLERALTESLARLPVSKTMRYQIHAGRPSQETVQFVRPARSLVALWGESVVPVSVLGLSAGRTTPGHRFLTDAPLELRSADSYERTLHEEGRVVVSFEDRRDAIREGLYRAAGEASVLIPEGLLDEVTALVEWPAIYQGTFEAEYLAVPQECLILTMQQNQRYFALTGPEGTMLNRFLLVSNIETSDPATIVAGNERVLRARLSDAKFFYEQDQKRTLAARLPLLDKVVYHHVLGSQGARTQRVIKIALEVAGALGVEPGVVERAARLAKADLVTEMVGEFPELQGVMGRYYALHDGEPPAVAQAIEEHYRPRFAKDALPRSSAGICVALADKLETMVGMFGVGNIPTGDRDPYGLRRHALGVLRILVENRLPLELDDLLRFAMAAFAESAGFSLAPLPIREFLYERLRTLLKDQGYSVSEVEAVVSLAPERVDVLPEQLQAVRSFNQLPEAASLAAANKRIGNILKKTELTERRVDVALLVEPAERALAEALARIEPEAHEQFASGDYTGMLKSLSALRSPVDLFFEQVMVMAPEDDLRKNRVALLDGLYRLMNRFADLSKLAV